MIHLTEFTLPSDDAEYQTLVYKKHPMVEMTCYSPSFYPFRIFPDKGLRHITFDPITIFCGGNGSGKSTLLNVIAGKLGLSHTSPHNDTPLLGEYLRLCDYETAISGVVPDGSRIITSDDVFDFLLDTRTINRGVDRQRLRLFDEYYTTKEDKGFVMRTLDDYEELKRRNEIRRSTKSEFTGRRLPKNLILHSNGESAYDYFTSAIESDALYLLDEPENSLSAKLQAELKGFIADSARFYNCQFIISTHSPFLLSLEGAKIYDLDENPVCEKDWHDVEAVRLYRELFN